MARFVALLASTAAGVNALDCAAAWAQCGGSGYQGPTCCEVGYRCEQVTTFYSQCVPETPPTPARQLATALAADECYELHSAISFNSLAQSFPSSPDSKAAGYASCKLCTRGKLFCTAKVVGGKTPLIASHIHVATNGDGVNGRGPAVINFCGDNSRGMILDGSPYISPCSHISQGTAIMDNMEGNFIEGDMNKGYTVATRVRDIAKNPGKYYFNVHSIASWTYWQLQQNQGAVGMCRGQLGLSNRRLASTEDVDGVGVLI